MATFSVRYKSKVFLHRQYIFALLPPLLCEVQTAQHKLVHTDSTLAIPVAFQTKTEWVVCESSQLFDIRPAAISN